jgi:DNA-binding protein HU-beta
MRTARSLGVSTAVGRRADLPRRSRALARIEGAVGKRETVNLVGFGRFEVYERSARRGRNLQSGEGLKIPAMRAVRFKVGKRMRDAAAGSKRKRAGKS